MNPKLNASVSVVKISDSVLEFFKSNTREQVRIRTKSDTIMNIVSHLDGNNDIEKLASTHDVCVEDVEKLISFLQTKGLLDNIDPKADFEGYDSFRRVINFLADYSTSHLQLVEMWNSIRNSTVVVIGVGAVGSWVAINLAQSGVKHLVLMDPDTIDISNIHRQIGYMEKRIGEPKTTELKKRINGMSPDAEVDIINDFLSAESVEKLDAYAPDLIINCADKPTVDETSLIIGEYGMKRGIPHIIGGGYNLHSSLIGQTIIPRETACAKCFQKQLDEDNKIDRDKVKKLAVKNRKVGSFGPMCAIIASMIGMEAVKVLTRVIPPANANRRGEMDIRTMEITYKNYFRRKDCDWCGEKGKYNC